MIHISDLPDDMYDPLDALLIATIPTEIKIYLQLELENMFDLVLQHK